MAVALSYYVAVVAEMYFREPERTEAVAPGSGYAWALGLCSVGTLAFGVAPSLALGLAQLSSVLLR